MANQTYQTTLNIVGNIDKKLIGDIKSLVGYNAKVITQTKEMAVASRVGFDSFAAGAGMAKGAMMSLGTSIKAALLPLLGITAGVELFTKFGKSITDSIELFRQYRDQITSFKAVIGESDIVQKHGYSAAALLSQYLGNSKEIAQEQGGIFMDQFYTGIQYKLVSTTSLGPKLAKPLTEALVNIAAQVKGSLRDLTQEDVETYTRMVAKAYKSGQLYRLGQLLGLSSADAKAFKAAAAEGNKELMTRILLSGTQVKISKEFIEQQIKSPEGQLMKARTQYLEQSLPLGKEWTDLWIQGQTMMYKLGTALIPVFEDLGNVILNLPIKEMTDSFVANFKTMYWSVKFFTWDLELAWKTMTGNMADQKWVTAVESSFAVLLAISTAAFEDWFSGIVGKWNLNIEHWIDDTKKQFSKWMSDEENALGDWFSGVIWKWTSKIENWIDATKKQFSAMMSDILFGWEKDFDSWLGKAGAKIGKYLIGRPPAAPILGGGANGAWDYNNIPHGASGAVLVGESGSEVITPVKNPGVFDDTLMEEFKHTDLLSQINETLQMLSLGSTSYFGGVGGFGGGVGGGGGGIGNLAPGKTEYGPAIDKPGSADWDKNSWNRIGSWPGLTGLLGSVPGVQDVAMHDSHAWNKYHVRPGGMYIDDQGRKCRFADHTGNRSETNEDYFKFAKGGIVTGAVRAILGEGASPEMVLPLNSSTLSKFGMGGNNLMAPVFNINVSGNATMDVISEIEDRLRNNFQSYLDSAYSDFRRKRIS